MLAQDIQLKVSAPVVKLLQTKFDPSQGARFVRKICRKWWRTLSRKKLFRKKGRTAHSFSRFKKDAVIISIKETPPPAGVGLIPILSSRPDFAKASSGTADLRDEWLAAIVPSGTAAEGSSNKIFKGSHSEPFCLPIYALPDS